MKSHIFVIVSIESKKILFKFIDRININDIILVGYVSGSPKIDNTAPLESAEGDIEIIQHHILILFIKNYSLEEWTHFREQTRRDQC